MLGQIDGVLDGEQRADLAHLWIGLNSERSLESVAESELRNFHLVIHHAMHHAVFIRNPPRLKP